MIAGRQRLEESPGSTESMAPGNARRGRPQG